ncbi:MAG TPA: aldo/keto reductase [Polyangia bacterium]|nr:aldo/keto reductase [Polyangia bacterium]
MATSLRFVPRRLLGRTGFAVTALGVGDVADRAIPLQTCVRTVERALDFGLNLVDTAPNYEDGYSEQIVGAALRARRRASVFLIDKIDHPAQPVAPQVAASLDRLGLPAVDLFVFHAVSTVAAWEALVAPGGPFAQLAACVRRGQARFRGISSHHPDVLARAIPSGLCDVVMFPIGPFVHPRYVNEILPLARAHGVGSVCFKTFGAGKLLGDSRGYNQPLDGVSGRAPVAPRLPRLTVADCVRYTLTVDPDVALLGMSSPEEQDQALEAAEAFEALPPDQLATVAQRAAVAVRGKGACHWDPPEP